jgi:dTDP-4-dehydrorhamnose reductase
MRVVILGDGLLGSELHQQTGWDILSRAVDGFDITQSNTFNKHLVECHDGICLASKYDVVINCIADTDTYNPDKQNHWNVNYRGVVDLVDFCNLHSIKLVHISSDYVYTNSVENAAELDVPIHGNNWYSYTKLLADGYIELRSNNYLICRGTHKPRPFPYEKAWSNQIGNFDYIDTIAKLYIDLVNKNATGIYNVGTSKKSLFDLAIQTREVLPAQAPSQFPIDCTMCLDKLSKL